MDGVAAPVTRREHRRGWSETSSRLPHPALRAHLARYWGYVERYSAPLRRRELPAAEVVLIISFGPVLHLADGTDEPSPRQTETSFVAGLRETSVVTEMDGASHGMQVNFSPLGAFTLLGLPMRDVANRVVSLPAALGAPADELAERLHEARSWGARFDVLDEVLLARLARAAPATPSVAWAWRRLLETSGRVGVASLAGDLGCSRKHLSTRFAEEVGLAPKTAARILRFDRAVSLIGADDGPSWGEIAAACGYYDQAHFNRDFKQFAGSTPTEFVERQIAGELGLAPE